jgi:cysteinyl-tRNA synthetase
LNINGQKAGTRGQDENKRSQHDFVLWFTKSKFENHALVWDSPWGRGYPGWHIECSAMSMKYLGEQFDIHAGGIDHIPIHHTNEIAQSEAATGKRWVNYWLHNEFLVLDKGKMSKSLGGFLTLQNLVDEGFETMDYRYFLLSGHYRSQLQFSDKSLTGARNSRKSLVEKVRALADKTGMVSGSPSETNPDESEKYLLAFNSAIEDDLSTPRALAELWGLLKDGPVTLRALGIVFDMDRVLGLGLEAACAEKKEKADDPEQSKIEELVARRTQAKKAKNFALADRIRQELKEKGIILEDGPEGTEWRRL